MLQTTLTHRRSRRTFFKAAAAIGTLAIPGVALAQPVALPLPGVYTIRQKSTNQYVDAHEESGEDFRVVTRDRQDNDTQR
jgi:hypothetical protein